MKASHPRYSWGRYPYEAQNMIRTAWVTPSLFHDYCLKDSVLPYGLGRSYGDSCLNTRGRLLKAAHHDHFLAFDDSSGILLCQSGVRISEIIEFCLPRGWFPAVTPGTKQVTVGGAIANDVHGKNHHGFGSFGNHVRSLGLIRSDGDTYHCSPTENADLFCATIGGLGLTGFIDWVEIQLIPLQSSYFDVEIIKFRNVDEYFQIEEESHQKYQYTVAWVDGLAKGKDMGHGLYTRGNPSLDPSVQRKYTLHRSPVRVPFDFPSVVLNPFSVKAFNFLYFNKTWAKKTRRVVHYDPFFYPLDVVDNWNRIYGHKGFLQYQFVLPEKGGDEILKRIMSLLAFGRQGSFLNVLKRFGSIPSMGLLSFPRPGYTYALDFPVTGAAFKLLQKLDEMVLEAGGAIYPAKDARMSAAAFQASFPRWKDFERFKDPKISSDLWDRVTGDNSSMWKVEP